MIYADIGFAAFPIHDIDSIGENGEIDKKSALYLIVNGVRYILILKYAIPLALYIVLYQRSRSPMIFIMSIKTLIL